MAVTKRTRFEVLRRDDHTCRYCRASDQPLTVDHVTPVALGGSDDPSNLVAACKDCNAGKSSSSPGAATVADVREDAVRHADLVRAAYAVLVERMGERDDYIDEFADVYTYQVPDGWRNSIARWHEMGVPVELVVDAAEKACSLTRNFRGNDRFRYFCGIVWNSVRTVSAEVTLREHFDGRWMTDEELTNKEIDAYQQGYAQAMKGTAPNVHHIISGRLLAQVIDGPRPLDSRQKVMVRDPRAELHEAVAAHG